MAKAFVRAGCSRIVLTDLNKATLADTCDAVRGINPEVQIYAHDGDISDEGFVETLVGEAVVRFQRIDYSVQCAGIRGSSLRSHEMTTDEFDLVNGVNYRGTWLVTRAVMGHMVQQEPLPGQHRIRKQRGAVVNVASQLGIVSRPGAVAYSASKAAVVNMTRADAIDYSQNGIRVNCVCPGIIDTPMTTGNKGDQERLQPAIEIAPMKRIGLPEEIADAVLFLCSREASFVQGHAFVVDGGYTIN